MVRDGEIVTVQHRDGSFRRFEIDADGRLGSADGAEQVAGRREADGTVTVRIGDATYRFAAGQLFP